MEKQQQNVPIIIALVGLGLIAGVFGLIIWLASGASEPLLQSNSDDNDQTSSATSSTAASDKKGLDTVEGVPQGLFNYGGSTTWIPVHETVQTAILEAFPDFQLRYTLPSSDAPGSGTGVKMLLDGQLSFSESSRPLKPEEYDAAQQRGFQLEQIPAAIDGIALAVNPTLGIPGLSVEQIQSIYTSEVSNWSELGGPDVPITAYGRSPEASGTSQYFLESVVAADAYGEDVLFVGDTTSGIREVAKDKGGIYYASAPEVVNQCSIYAIPVAGQEQPENFVNPFDGTWRTGQDCIDQANTLNKEGFRSGDYPLTRRLFVIVKADEASDEAAGRAYADILLSPGGQSLIEEAGFVSIR
ncbi:MAG: PstS family phosphate ABC transporter substrate-binding protein [Cyanobacteria bacterium P01_D01_bin.156]